MYLLEAKGDEALDLIADLIDPISDIASDAKIARCIQTGQKLKACKFALKDHKKTVKLILAICEGCEPDEYRKTAPQMLFDLLKLINDPEIEVLFTSPEQTNTGISSTSATANTEE